MSVGRPIRGRGTSTVQAGRHWLDFARDTGIVFWHFPTASYIPGTDTRTVYGGLVKLTRSNLPGKGVSEHSDCPPVVEERGRGAPEYR